MAREDILCVVVRQHASFDHYDIFPYADRHDIDRVFNEYSQDVSFRARSNSLSG